MCAWRGQRGRELGLQLRTEPVSQIAPELERPPQRKGEREGATIEKPALTHLRRSQRRYDRLQFRRPLGGGQKLQHAGIREAVHPNPTVGPRLRGCPSDRVGSIGRLAGNRVKFAR